MLKDSRNLRDTAQNRCAICDGRFGLVRYYTWSRMGLCSKKCRDRYRTRQAGGLRWLHQMQGA
jgi:hypothetical protein